jgi:hypothetical protein
MNGQESGSGDEASLKDCKQKWKWAGVEFLNDGQPGLRLRKR